MIRALFQCFGERQVSQPAFAVAGVPDCGNASGAYVTNAMYAAHGAPTQYVFGNNVWHLPNYNGRLQMSGFTDQLYTSATNTFAVMLSGVLKLGDNDEQWKPAGEQLQQQWSYLCEWVFTVYSDLYV